MPDPKIRFDILANAQGSETVARLAGELEKLDKAVDPETAAHAQALAAQLRALGEQTAAVSNFRALKEQTAAAAAALEEAQANAQSFGRGLAATEAPTRAQAGQMQKLRDAVRDAKQELQAQTASLDSARGNLTQLGIATDGVARKEVELRGAAQGVRQEIQQLGQQQQAVQRFGELSAAAERARVNLAAADAALETFRAEMARTAAPTAAQVGELGRLSEAARGAQIAVQQQALAQAQAGAALRAAGVSVDRLTAAEARARSEAGALAQAHVRTGLAAQASGAQQVAATEKSLGATSRLGSVLAGISGLFGRLGGALAAAFAGREFINTITQAESLRRGLAAVTGSSEAARTEFDYLKRTSNELGLELQSTGKAYLNLAASTQGTALEGQATRAVFEAVSRAMSTLGKSSEETERALLAVGQMASKGTVSMEELRGQLGEALPGALKATADGAGITVQQLIKMVETGNVLAKDLLPALTKGLNNLYANGSPPESLQSNFNRLKNTVTEAAIAISDSGIGTAITKTLGGAAVIVTTVASSYAEAAKRVGEFAGNVSQGNFTLAVNKERLDETIGRIRNVAVAAGLAAPEVAKVGEAAGDASLKVRDQFRNFERQAELSAISASTLTQVTVDLAQKFEELRAKGDSAAEAIGKIGKDFDLSTSPGIVQAEAALNRLSLNAEITAKQVQQAWSAALAGMDLAQFQQRAQAAFAGTTGEARKLQEVVDAIGNEALRRAGTSAEELRTGFSLAMNSAIHDTDALGGALDNLGVKGEEAGRLLAGSLTKELSTADTEKAIQSVIGRMQALGAQGKLTGIELREGLEAARSKLDGLREGVNSVEEAFRTLGLQSPNSLRVVADTARQAFEVIRNDGTQSARAVLGAFDRYAEAAIAAARASRDASLPVIEAQLELQRRVIETKAKAESLGDAFKSSMGTARSATDDATAGVEGLISATDRLLIKQHDEATSIEKNDKRLLDKDYADRLNGAVNGYPSKSTRGGDSGLSYRQQQLQGQNAVDNNLVFELLEKEKSGTLTKDDLGDAQAVLAALKQNQLANASATQLNAGFMSLSGQRAFEAQLTQMKAIVARLGGSALTGSGGGGYGLNPAGGFAKPADRQPGAGTTVLTPTTVVAGAPALAKAPAPSPAPAPDAIAKPSSAGLSSHTVNIVINGKNTPVGMASQSDAETLAGVLRELAAAAGRAIH